MIVSQRTDTSAVEQSLPVPSCFVAEADLCRFYSRRATGVDSLAFTSDGSWLAVGRTDGQIDLYDHAAYRLIMVTIDVFDQHHKTKCDLFYFSFVMRYALLCVVVVAWKRERLSALFAVRF